MRFRLEIHTLSIRSKEHIENIQPQTNQQFPQKADMNLPVKISCYCSLCTAKKKNLEDNIYEMKQYISGEYKKHV